MTGTDAACADLDASDSTLTDCLNFLKIRVPCATGLVVGMADVVTETNTLAADFTNFRHKNLPPEITKHYLLS